MSQIFFSYLMYSIAAIIMFSLALKFCYQRLSESNTNGVNSIGINKGIKNIDYPEETDEEMESISRMTICLNYIIWIGIVLFVLLTIFYFFHFFDNIPVNPAKW